MSRAIEVVNLIYHFDFVDHKDAPYGDGQETNAFQLNLSMMPSQKRNVDGVLNTFGKKKILIKSRFFCV